MEDRKVSVHYGFLGGRTAHNGLNVILQIISATERRRKRPEGGRQRPDKMKSGNGIIMPEKLEKTTAYVCVCVSDCEAAGQTNQWQNYLNYRGNLTADGPMLAN